ncbi:hypothetical protein LY78DRAFT_457493 [Colletotrichum sublineola]|nr:hypothetical protein LY78DRAFT_457493 [Colletotrichum sublineola]
MELWRRWLPSSGASVWVCVVPCVITQIKLRSVAFNPWLVLDGKYHPIEPRLLSDPSQKQQISSDAQSVQHSSHSSRGGVPLNHQYFLGMYYPKKGLWPSYASHTHSARQSLMLSGHEPLARAPPPSPLCHQLSAAGREVLQPG